MHNDTTPGSIETRLTTDGGQPRNGVVQGSHERFIGDEIERAVEIIGEETDSLNSWVLANAHADGEVDPDVELRGNYLYVSVEWEADDGTSVRGSHNQFIGDEIERAVEIIGQETSGVTEWELVSAYADDEINPDLELRGNYLHVAVEYEREEHGE